MLDGVVSAASTAESRWMIKTWPELITDMI